MSNNNRTATNFRSLEEDADGVPRATLQVTDSGMGSYSIQMHIRSTPATFVDVFSPDEGISFMVTPPEPRVDPSIYYDPFDRKAGKGTL